MLWEQLRRNPLCVKRKRFKEREILPQNLTTGPKEIRTFLGTQIFDISYTTQGNAI